MKKLLTILSALAITATLSANNISITNLGMTGTNATDHYTLVQFDISWENSWRTSSAPNNWDAAWVFVKYRIQPASGGDGEWHHAWLNNTGQTAPAGSTIDIGLQTPGTAFNATTNPGLGAFLYRNADGTGTLTKTGVQLRWNYGGNFKTGSTPIGDNDIVDVQVFAIEMVYVPEGSFAVGSGGTESGSFTNGSWASGATVPLSISSESDLTIAHSTGNLWGTSVSGNNTIGDPGTLAAAFPKGYNAFYCMKYELSQQQYVDFLNTLTQTQATARKYDKSTPNYRYEITGSAVGSYVTAYPYVACNYLSWMDGAAYTDWAGLRPMTELEFEKVCRGTATPVAGEYAWGNTLIAGTAYTLGNVGAATEAIATNYSATAGNASYSITDGSIDGPLRVGIFAGTSGNTGRVTAGSTFYGIMEMSGNLWERTVTIGNATGRAFTGVHGNGTLSAAGFADISTWPGYNATEVGSGFRGGSGGDFERLCVSDRFSAAEEVLVRSANHGFRAVRSLALPSLTTTVASSISFTTATSGGNITSDGGITVTARGVCYSTTTNPTLAGNYTTNGTGTGTFTSTLSGLTSNTTYYIRAYATTTRGTSYGNEVSFTTLGTCGSFTVSHVTSGGVAPLNKTVTYGTVTGVPGVTTKCWITSNLGADHQATSVNDATEASAGWYWQFNRKQGYKHDGTLTPATWSATCDASATWDAAKDPCTIELGAAWRIPTNTEWTNVNTSGGWSNYNYPWNSGLKMHAAGYLVDSNGSLHQRGSNGYYWSSVEASPANGNCLYFHSGASSVGGYQKADGFTLRCLRDMIPTVSTTVITNIGSTTATGGGNVISECGSAVTARGVCWSTTATPTTANSHTSDGTGAGTFSSTITGLSAGTLYYVRAYATNSAGTAYGNEVSFTTAWVCGASFTRIHAAGDVAPVSKTVTYGTVSTTLFGGTKCAITQNLGANQQAASPDDATEASAGWYWQFNRQQGYQYTTSRAPAGWDATMDNQSATWEATKDPCTLELGSGWRIPTNTEWTAADANGSWNNYDNAYASVLKLHAAGYLGTSDGSLTNRGSIGFYWSSTEYDDTFGWRYYGWSLGFSSSSSDMSPSSKAFGYSVRCLKDLLPTLTTTAVTAITNISATSGGNVTDDGGSAITARGVCWSITTAPTITDPHTSDGTGTGMFTSTLSGLVTNTLYYVRAYTSNSTGTAYGNQVTCTTLTSFSIGQSYGGGIIFYIDGTGQHGLIAATSDQSSGAAWCLAPELIGGTSTAIGSGQTNTTAIVTKCTSSAAYICDILVLNGYNDWFLPSKDELHQLYLQRNLVGGFADDYYWSSSEYDLNDAWSHHFQIGFQGNLVKYNTYYLRAVRSF